MKAEALRRRKTNGALPNPKGKVRCHQAQMDQAVIFHRLGCTVLPNPCIRFRLAQGPVRLSLSTSYSAVLFFYNKSASSISISSRNHQPNRTQI
jgi:hypothetical protein